MKKPELLPDAPGVYLMKDKAENIIYVGKAVSLKKRVSQYFQRIDQNPRTKALIKNIADLEYIVAPTEIDALILESNLIKEYKPRYNVSLKDDKQYPFIKVTINEDYPRIVMTRRRLQDGARYFGPYINSRAARETVKLISQIFKFPQCKKKSSVRGRPCLNFQLGLCSAACSGTIDKEKYNQAVDEAIQLLEGKNDNLLQTLKNSMQDAVLKQDFEAAAVLRDQLQAVQTISKPQQVTGGFDDSDAISIARSGDIACAQVLYIRDGSLVGRGEFTLDSKDADDGEVMSAFLKQYYNNEPIPREILLDIVPDDPAIVQWLQKAASRKVDITVPAKGRKKELVEMASKNAQSMLNITLLKEEKREKSSYSALVELQDILDLECAPEHVEAFDISNIGGTDAVGSKVVFTGGRPDRRQYRHFNIKTVNGIDDPAMMKEVISRRIARITRGEDILPDLIVVDGGPTQLAAARSALHESNVNIPVIGLAKQFEHIYIPDADNPLILPETSPALTLLKHIRDESHRFAISHHRRRRSSRLRASVLDGVPGIGKKRKEILLKHFGSLEGIKAASREELEKVPGFSKLLAGTVFDRLHVNRASKSL
jgi:excinuclease ABC subunit C